MLGLLANVTKWQSLYNENYTYIYTLKMISHNYIGRQITLNVVCKVKKKAKAIIEHIYF